MFLSYQVRILAYKQLVVKSQRNLQERCQNHPFFPHPLVVCPEVLKVVIVVQPVVLVLIHNIIALLLTTLVHLSPYIYKLDSESMKST